MASKKPQHTGPRVVHFYKGQLLVARLQNTAGKVIPTVVSRAMDAPPIPDHPWASGKIFSVEWEEDVKKGLADCKHFEDFIKRMRHFKYRMDEAAPGFKRKPFLRL